MTLSIPSKIFSALLFALFILFAGIEYMDPSARDNDRLNTVFNSYLPVVHSCYDGDDSDDSYQCTQGPIVSDEIYQGYPNDSNDYYLIDLKVKGTIKATISNYQAVGDLVLRDETMKIRDHWGKGGSIMHVVGTDLDPGEYYIQVYTDEMHGFNNKDPYSLTATFPTPTIAITYPKKKAICSNPPADPFCRFEIRGSSGLNPLGKLRVYAFIYPLEPAGGGWYIQFPRAEIEANGDWLQAPAYLGNDGNPAETGDRVRIRAAVVTEDATYHGIPLDDLPPGTFMVITDIKRLVAISNTTEPTVQR